MGHEGMARIGNRRRDCATCNNFAANVRRLTAARLKAAHQAEWDELQLRVEMDRRRVVIGPRADHLDAAHPALGRRDRPGTRPEVQVDAP